jgi:hypothetical protein
MQTLYANGRVRSIVHRTDGVLHRIDGPTYQYWGPDGVLIEEEWYQNGYKHRDGKPAYRKWNDAGQLVEEKWYQHHRKLSQEEIEQIVRPDTFRIVIASLPQPLYEEIWEEFRTI